MISRGLYLLLAVFLISIYGQNAVGATSEGSLLPVLNWGADNTDNSTSELDIEAFPIVGENENGIPQVYFIEEINFEVVGDFSDVDEEASYEWSFGDGNTAEGMKVSHNFEDLGELVVELTITESDGNINTIVKPIEVIVNIENIGPGCPSMEVEVEEGILPNSSSEDETFDEYYVLPKGEEEINISANFVEVGSSDYYEVESIPYQQVVPYTGVNPTNIYTDDVWSEIIDLGFDFSFFGEYYNNAMVASNGALTFSIDGLVPDGEYVPGNMTPWVIGGEIPSNEEADSRFKNAIFGVLQDTYPSDNYFDDWTINYQLIGEAPCRTMIFNMYNLGLYNCGSDLGPQTYQMIIYETTNVIDIQVKDRTACEGWNNGNGIIGIQNNDRTVAFTPEGRNSGAWETHNEAWRFTPAGENSDYTFTWTDESGNVISSEATIEVGPGTYMAKVEYGPQNSGGRFNESGIIKTKKVKVYPGFATNMEMAEDLYTCVQPGEKGIFNLTQNNSVIGDGNPEDFTVKYYNSEVAARSDYSPIAAPENYQSRRDGQTIYVRVAKNGINANEIESFALNNIESGIAYPPEDIVVESDEDYVDLTQVSSEVLGDQNPADFVLYFYVTELDALNRQNPIANPESFQLEEEEMTIWVVLENLNDSDCFDTTDFEITTTMSVSSFENYTKIWPNPVSDILYVENTKETITGLTLYDLQGRIIKQTNEKELNVTELSSGVYFVEVKGSTSAYIKRVIVE